MDTIQYLQWTKKTDISNLEKREKFGEDFLKKGNFIFLGKFVVLTQSFLKSGWRQSEKTRELLRIWNKSRHIYYQ